MSALFELLDSFSIVGLLDQLQGPGLVLNEIEAEQLESSCGQVLQSLGVDHIFVTRGSRGGKHFDKLFFDMN